MKGSTVLGAPDNIVQLGTTEIPKELFTEQLRTLEQHSFKGSLYDLFTHNCNTFSNEIAQFLVGANIPEYILDLPSTILNT